jgi:uncharacterized repeat protein (TIGR01451 family)
MKKSIAFFSLVLLLLQFLLPTPSNTVYADLPNDVSQRMDVIHSSLIINDAEGNLISPDLDGNYADVPRDAILQVRYEFNLLDENPDTQEEYLYVAGDVYQIQLPDELTYNVPATGKNLIVNGTSDVLGVLKVDANGLATITFTDYVQTHTGMFGWFEINGTFSDEILDTTTTEPVSLVFEGEIIQIGLVAPDEPNVAVSVAKSGVYDPSTNRITWTILVTPDGRTSGIIVDDVYSSNQTFVVGSMTKNGLPVTPTFTSSTRTIRYAFPSSIDSVQTLTYQTSPTSTAFTAENGSTEILSFTNTARVYRDSTQLAESAATIQTNWITKTGSLDGTDKQLIHWSVRVNLLKQSLSGAWINDLLPAGLTPVDGTFYLRLPDNSRIALTQAAIETLGSYTVTTQSDGKTLVRYLFDQTITDTYGLEFDARVTDLAIYNTNAGTTYTNTASMSWSTNTSGTPSDTAAVGVITPGGIISKTVAGNNQNFNRLTNNLHTWTVTLNRNNVAITNARFVDFIPKSMEYVAGSFSVSTPGVNGTFTYTPADPSDLTKSGTIEYLFTDPLSTSVTLTFRTRLVTFDMLYVNANVNLPNTAYLYGDGIRDTVQSSTVNKTVRSQMIAKDISAAYNYQTRKITWRLVINRNQLIQNNVVVTDLIPAGLTLLPGTLTLSTLDAYSFTPTLYPVSDLTSRDAFTLSFPGVLDHQVIVTFQTEVKEGYLLINGNKTFTNNVVYSSDEIPNLTASASQIVNNTIVTKSGNYVTGSDYIQWGVTINPNAVSFTDIELIDALQAGLALDTASVRLYAMTLQADGSLVKAATPMDPSTYEVVYDESTRIFIFKILGTTNSPYRLEFTTDVLVERINVNNVITMNGSGTVNNAGSTAISVVVLDDGVSAGGGGIVGEIRVRKGSSDQPELNLQGATFGIYNSFGRKVAEATTGEDGIAVFSNLGMKTYSIVELVAPYGYTIDPTPIKVRLTTTANIAAVEQLNDPITGSLTLNKTLLDYLGQPIQESRPFTLKVTGPSYPDGEEFVVLAGTPFLIENLVLGEYSVVEIGSEGYDVSVGSAVTLSVESQSASITVTNQEIRGVLTLEKTLLDYLGQPIQESRPFTLTVTGPSYPEGIDVEVVAGTPLVLEGLLLGEYTVVETGAQGYDVSISSAVLLSEQSRQGTITVTNREVRGTLSIEKILLDANGNAKNEVKEFEIKITGPSYPSGQTFLIQNGTPLKLEGLLMGEYSVEELNASAYIVTGSEPIRLTNEARSATMTITNREKPKLPHTGIGFDPTVYLAGSLLILLGLLLRKPMKGTR